MTITAEQRNRLTNLHSALINDITDEMGMRNNVIPCTRLEALWFRDPVVGTAHPAQRVEIGYEKQGEEEQSEFFDYLEATERGDFIVMAAPSGTQVGLWGELLSTIVQENGAQGALIDGPTRDSRLIEEHEFPVWAEGHSAIESFGRVAFQEYDVPVKIDDVTIYPGDVVFADYESIVVIDPGHLEQVIEEGEGELESENNVHSDIRDGDSVHEVWERYGTL